MKDYNELYDWLQHDIMKPAVIRNSDTVTAGPIMAMSLVSVIPILIVFFSLQKYFVEGIARQGVKD